MPPPQQAGPGLSAAWRAVLGFAAAALLCSAALALKVGAVDATLFTWGAVLSPVFAAGAIAYAHTAVRSKTELMKVQLLCSALGICSALLLSTGLTDPSQLFVSYARHDAWAFRDGVWENAVMGVRVLGNGELEALPGAATGAPELIGSTRRVEALLGVLPLAALAPVWVVLPLSVRAKAWAGLSCFALLALLTQAVSAERVSQYLLPTAALPLLLQLAATRLRQKATG